MSTSSLATFQHQAPLKQLWVCRTAPLHWQHCTIWETGTGRSEWVQIILDLMPCQGTPPQGPSMAVFGLSRGVVHFEASLPDKPNNPFIPYVALGGCTAMPPEILWSFRKFGKVQKGFILFYSIFAYWLCLQVLPMLGVLWFSLIMGGLIN